jgi:hypothetical protein
MERPQRIVIKQLRRRWTDRIIPMDVYILTPIKERKRDYASVRWYSGKHGNKR